MEKIDTPFFCAKLSITSHLCYNFRVVYENMQTI